VNQLDEKELTVLLPKVFDPSSKEEYVGWASNKGAVLLNNASGANGRFQWYAYSKPDYVIRCQKKDLQIPDEEKYALVKDRLNKITTFNFKAYRYIVDGEAFSVEIEERISRISEKKYWMVGMAGILAEFEASLITFESESYPQAWVYSRYVKLKNLENISVVDGFRRGCSILRIKLLENLKIVSSTMVEIEELKQETKTVEVKVRDEIESLLNSLSP
jgi:hypothetical protein